MTCQFSPACERNREPILAVLRDAFAGTHKVLEIGSGTGQHAVYFGRHLPHLVWQTSDLRQNHPSILAWQQQAALPNVLPPLALDVGGAWPDGNYDAVFSANTCHIMAWDEVRAMFAGIGRVLAPGGLALYGPFNYGGTHTGPGNARFDAALRAQAPHMGIRDAEAVGALAAAQGLTQMADHAMPADNHLLVWRRKSTPPTSPSRGSTPLPSG